MRFHQEFLKGFHQEFGELQKFPSEVPPGIPPAIPSGVPIGILPSGLQTSGDFIRGSSRESISHFTWNSSRDYIMSTSRKSIRISFRDCIKISCIINFFENFIRSSYRDSINSSSGVPVEFPSGVPYLIISEVTLEIQPGTSPGSSSGNLT